MQLSEPSSAPSASSGEGDIPLLLGKDIGSLGMILAGLGIVRIVPERQWSRVTRLIPRSRVALDRQWAAPQLRYLNEMAGETPFALPTDVVLQNCLSNRSLAKFQSLRCRYPDAWRPPSRLEGHAHVEAALAAGRGAILWVAPFVFAPLLSKVAFHAAGLSVSHLSRYSHGYSTSQLGARYLNPIQTRIEERFLAERIVIGPDGAPREAMRSLTARLEANRLVSVSVGGRGRRTATVPFMNGAIRIATGVPRLAARTGATILPVFTGREATGDYVARVEAAIPAGGESEQAALETVSRFAGLLEQHVRRWPDQFWWHYDIMEPLMPRGRQSA